MKLDEQTLQAVQRQNDLADLRLDTKQHCQKILQGIGKFDDKTACRAIWELVQNARDLAKSGDDGNKRVRIRIELSDDSLLFAHDGKNFNHGSLSSLIKQVSSEEKEDSDAAGQFGTGFMTTHKYGRVFHIRGAYEVYEGKYVKLDDFEVDRSANELSEMRDAMAKQLLNVKELLKKEYAPDREEWTEFIYDTDTEERRRSARQGVEAAMNLMPYVMTINERIFECCIKQKDGTTTVFTKQQLPDDEDLHVMRIWKNNTPIDCFYLQSEDRKDTIILPLASATEAKNIGTVPRLYIFFPLLGTEVNQINYIYHSERFYPTEPRDLIILPDGNTEHQFKIDTDVGVLEEMDAMLFNYLQMHADRIKNGIYLAPIGFDMLLRKNETMEYFSKRHQTWVDVFKHLPLVDMCGKNVCVEETDKVQFLSHSIVEFLKQDENEKYLDVVYDFASMVSNLPKKENVLEWSDIVYKWNPEETKWFVTIEKIVEQIQPTGDKAMLLKFLKYLKNSGQSVFFSYKAIIPNREGDLCTSSNLRDGECIPKGLYDVCKPLVPEFTSKLVDEEFAGIEEFTKISRDDLKTALSNFVETQWQLSEPFNGKIEEMLQFCMTFPTEKYELTDRYKALGVLCRKYTGVPLKVNYVAHLGDADKEQIMYKVVFDALVKYEFDQIQKMSDINEKWYLQAENAEFLYDFISSLSDEERQTSYQTKIMPDYAVFPNRNGHLCFSSELAVIEQDNTHPHTEQDIDTLNEYYKDVIGKDKRDTWVDCRFESFQTFKKDQPILVANEIASELHEQNYAPNTTLEIFSHLDREEDIWIHWFSNINSQKPQIFLNRIDGEKNRANIYTLMKTSDDQLEKLAMLSENEDMDAIIEEGMRAIERNKYQEIHTCFIKDLGSFAESILLDQLKNTLDDKQLHIDVCDEQGGQDYKVMVGDEVVYYIEVKSRWSTSDSVEMSPLQFKTSVEHKGCYSLCYVDMTWKSTNGVGDRSYDDLQTCLGHTRVLHDIGSRNEWCIESVQNTLDRPHIGGSYSLTVPQVLFKDEAATGFDGLIERIRMVIELNLSKMKESACKGV